MNYKINEIFTSIQGEGIHTGLPTTFIRLSGCNLRCRWCDTKYALDPENGKDMSIDGILSSVQKDNGKFICLTGGEPLLQSDISTLITTLIVGGYNVDIETNGSIDISNVVKDHPEVMISMDVKPPSSGESESLLVTNISYLRGSDQLKFIIEDDNDLNHAFMILEKYRPPSNIIFTPCSYGDGKFIAERLIGKLKDPNLSEILKRTRLMVQTHKVIWDRDQKGV